MKKGYSLLKNGIKYVELDGAKGGHDLGRQNGEIFKEEICHNLSILKNSFYRLIGKKKSEQLFHDVVHNNSYLNNLKQYMPELYNELLGIKEGSEISLEDAFLLNYIEEPAREIQSIMFGAKCTSGVLFNRGKLPNMVYQNMDYAKYFDDYQVLYKIKKPEIEILMYGFVGQFGGIGINSKSVAITVNTILNGRINIGFGIPSTAITRGLLEKDSVESSIDWIKQIPVSTANFYIVGSFERAVYLECSANKVIVDDGTGENFMARTNHAVKTDDIIDVEGFKGKEILTKESGYTFFKTRERYNLINNIMADKAEKAETPDIIEALSTDPILFDTDEGCTLQSMIAVCDQRDPHLFVARGFSPNREYIKISF